QPDYGAARWNLTLALGLQKLDAEAEPDRVYDQGVALLQRRKFDEAVDHFRAAIRKQPKDVKAYLGLGMAFQYQGDHDRARAAFRDALDIDPKNDGALRGIALTLQ